MVAFVSFVLWYGILVCPRLFRLPLPVQLPPKGGHTAATVAGVGRVPPHLQLVIPRVFRARGSRAAGSSGSVAIASAARNIDGSSTAARTPASEGGRAVPAAEEDSPERAAQMRSSSAGGTTEGGQTSVDRARIEVVTAEPAPAVAPSMNVPGEFESSSVDERQREPLPLFGRDAPTLPTRAQVFSWERIRVAEVKRILQPLEAAKGKALLHDATRGREEAILSSDVGSSSSGGEQQMFSEILQQNREPRNRSQRNALAFLRTLIALPTPELRSQYLNTYRSKNLNAATGAASDESEDEEKNYRSTTSTAAAIEVNGYSNRRRKQLGYLIITGCDRFDVIGEQVDDLVRRMGVPAKDIYVMLTRCQPDAIAESDAVCKKFESVNFVSFLPENQFQDLSGTKAGDTKPSNDHVKGSASSGRTTRRLLGAVSASEAAAGPGGSGGSLSRPHAQALPQQQLAGRLSRSMRIDRPGFNPAEQASPPKNAAQLPPGRSAPITKTTWTAPARVFPQPPLALATRNGPPPPPPPPPPTSPAERQRPPLLRTAQVLSSSAATGSGPKPAAAPWEINPQRRAPRGKQAAERIYESLSLTQHANPCKKLVRVRADARSVFPALNSEFWNDQLNGFFHELRDAGPEAERLQEKKNNLWDQIHVRLHIYYMWALGFLYLFYDYVAVLEDDLILSPSVDKFFRGVIPVMEADYSLISASAWNDNALEVTRNIDVKKDYRPPEGVFGPEQRLGEQVQGGARRRLATTSGGVELASTIREDPESQSASVSARSAADVASPPAPASAAALTSAPAARLSRMPGAASPSSFAEKSAEDDVNEKSTRVVTPLPPGAHVNVPQSEHNAALDPSSMSSTTAAPTSGSASRSDSDSSEVNKNRPAASPSPGPAPATEVVVKPSLTSAPATTAASFRRDALYVLRENHFGGLGWMTSRRVFEYVLLPFMTVDRLTMGWDSILSFLVDKLIVNSKTGYPFVAGTSGSGSGAGGSGTVTVLEPGSGTPGGVEDVVTAKMVLLRQDLAKAEAARAKQSMNKASAAGPSAGASLLQTSEAADHVADYAEDGSLAMSTSSTTANTTTSLTTDTTNTNPALSVSAVTSSRGEQPAPPPSPRQRQLTPTSVARANAAPPAAGSSYGVALRNTLQWTAAEKNVVASAVLNGDTRFFTDEMCDLWEYHPRLAGTQLIENAIASHKDLLTEIMFKRLLAETSSKKDMLTSIAPASLRFAETLIELKHKGVPLESSPMFARAAPKDDKKAAPEQDHNARRIDLLKQSVYAMSGGGSGASISWDRVGSLYPSVGLTHHRTTKTGISVKTAQNAKDLDKLQLWTPQLYTGVGRQGAEEHLKDFSSGFLAWNYEPYLAKLIGLERNSAFDAGPAAAQARQKSASDSAAVGRESTPVPPPQTPAAAMEPEFRAANVITRCLYNAFGDDDSFPWRYMKRSFGMHGVGWGNTPRQGYKGSTLAYRRGAWHFVVARYSPFYPLLCLPCDLGLSVELRGMMKRDHAESEIFFGGGAGSSASRRFSAPGLQVNRKFRLPEFCVAGPEGSRKKLGR